MQIKLHRRYFLVQKHSKGRIEEITQMLRALVVPFCFIFRLLKNTSLPLDTMKITLWT